MAEEVHVTTAEVLLQFAVSPEGVLVPMLVQEAAAKVVVELPVRIAKVTEVLAGRLVSSVQVTWFKIFAELPES